MGIGFFSFVIHQLPGSEEIAEKLKAKKNPTTPVVVAEQNPPVTIIKNEETVTTCIEKSKEEKDEINKEIILDFMEEDP